MRRFFCFLVSLIFLFIVVVPGALAHELKFSRSFLGCYVKSMQYKDRIWMLSEKYSLDPLFILAIMMYESCGNNLVSRAGAKGEMQVIDQTKAFMDQYWRSESDYIEAGVRYISYLKKEYFGDDYAKILLAYNAGPTRVLKEDSIKFETFQYGPGAYNFYYLLSKYFEEIDLVSNDLLIIKIGNQSDWESIKDQANTSILELRMFNPFLATRVLQEGQFIVYPKNPTTVDELWKKVKTPWGLEYLYEVGLGDVLPLVIDVFEIDRSKFRDANKLAFYSPLLPGEFLNISNSKYILKHLLLPPSLQ